LFSVAWDYKLSCIDFLGIPVKCERWRMQLHISFEIWGLHGSESLDTIMTQKITGLRFFLCSFISTSFTRDVRSGEKEGHVVGWPSPICTKYKYHVLPHVYRVFHISHHVTVNMRISDDIVDCCLAATSPGRSVLWQGIHSRTSQTDTSGQRNFAVNGSDTVPRFQLY